jgi:hypothetical protein
MMVVHAAIISPLFIVAFALTYIGYYRLDPKRRVVNARFPLMVFSALSAFAYPIVNKSLRGSSDLAPISYGFLAMAIVCLGLAGLLLRTLPPAEKR